MFVLSNWEQGTSHVCWESVVQSVWWHDDGAGGAAPAHPGGPGQDPAQHREDARAQVSPVPAH